jgi:hypothetical protein
MKYSKKIYENEDQDQSQEQSQDQSVDQSEKDKLPRKLKKQVSNKNTTKLKKLTDKLEKKSITVSEFVEKFKKIASDSKVQAILKAGQTDGDQTDEKLDYTEGSIPVKDLIPTQSEIGFNQSIQNILTDQYGSLDSILSGNADVGGPIVIYNGKYIIDGHHRWSQVYAANPEAKMKALNIKGNLEPTQILKIVHLAIATKVGGVPSADPKGINILNGIEESKVLEAVNSKMLSKKAKEIWSKYGHKDNASISKHIYDNLLNLINNNKPVDGAPGRKHMPQTDVGVGKDKGLGAEEKVKQKLDLLQKGIINFKNPDPSDVKVKESHIIKSYQKFFENWKNK